jgi:antitoxin ParD1/3/4
MNVSIGTHWEKFVDGLVQSGRYGSASEVIRDALRLVEVREEKLEQLRRSLKATIDEDVWYTADEVIDYINTTRHEDKPASDAAE